MVVLSHPVGNQNVRQALLALHEAGMLERFHTTISWNSQSRLNQLLPGSVRAELNRRSYPQVPQNCISTTPVRESVRLLSPRLRMPQLSAFSVLRVAKSIDSVTARTVLRTSPSAVYAYEGVALRTFHAAQAQRTIRIYELPSGYWHYERDLLQEEADLRPEYAGTIEKLRDPLEHIEAKDEELSLADYVIVPSQHVKSSLQKSSVPATKIRIVPYGTDPAAGPVRVPGPLENKKLRVLFVGALTQRKGISYLLDAVDSLGSKIELTLIGRKVGVCAPIDAAVQKHQWIPSLPHQEVLQRMSESDVLVLPSLSEGFGLVVTEALSRGLPVITTRNSGSSEVVRDGDDGFLVPIRSADAIAEKLQLLHHDRALLESMSVSASARAREFSWKRYRNLLISTITDVAN